VGVGRGLTVTVAVGALVEEHPFETTVSV